MGMKPIVQLKVGDVVRTLRQISPTMVRHWLYASECVDIGGGIMAGVDLVIGDLSAVPGKAWVRLAIPGRVPPGFLKVAGGELAANFDFVR